MTALVPFAFIAVVVWLWWAYDVHTHDPRRISRPMALLTAGVATATLIFVVVIAVHLLVTLVEVLSP